MQPDILDRLRLDPGQRTLGQLIQDREAAFHEIRRLRGELERLRAMRTAAAAKPQAGAKEQPSQPALRPGTLITMRQLRALLGVAHSTIYRWMLKGQFPRPVRVSPRAIRWKVEDIEQWRNSLDESFS